MVVVLVVVVVVLGVVVVVVVVVAVDVVGFCSSNTHHISFHENGTSKKRYRPITISNSRCYYRHGNSNACSGSFPEQSEQCL